MVSGDASLNRAMSRMITVLDKLQKKAEMVMRYGLFIKMASLAPLCVVPAPKTIMAKAAPNAAAFEIPRVKGEPKGFRKMLCITVPDTLSAVPARIADKTRGKRMLKMICCFIESASELKIWMMSFNDIEDAPITNPKKIKRISKPELPIRKRRFLLVNLLYSLIISLLIFSNFLAS